MLAAPAAAKTVKVANADPNVDRIEFRPGVNAIRLASPVVYTGARALEPAAAGKDGIRIDEADEGGIYLPAIEMQASGNLDENVKLTQTQDGSASEGGIVARFSRSTVSGSLEGDGIKLASFDTGDEENPAGTAFASFQSSEATGNDSDDIQIDAGRGELVIRANTVDKLDLAPGINLVALP